MNTRKLVLDRAHSLQRNIRDIENNKVIGVDFNKDTQLWEIYVTDPDHIKIPIINAASNS